MDGRCVFGLSDDWGLIMYDFSTILMYIEIFFRQLLFSYVYVEMPTVFENV